MTRARGTWLAAGVAVAAAVAVALPAFAVTPVSAGGALVLSPSTLAARPYTLLTYAIVHAGAWHAAVNVAAIVAGAAYMVLKRRAVLLLPLAVLSVVVAGLAFCAAAAVARHPGASLAGASALVFALVAYASVYGGHRLLSALLGALALAGLFGPNAGGAVAHCAGMAVGALVAWLDLRRLHRRRAAAALRREQLRRKVLASGYASLTDAERRCLQPDNHDS